MSSRLSAMVMVTGALLFPSLMADSAAAGVGGKNYFTIVSFLDFINGDCFQFEDDNTFIASNGLIIGEWSEEGILFFDYFEVTIDSPENPVYTFIEVLGGKVIAGKIETDDGDSGFFAGFESERICAYPARRPGNKQPGRTASPESEPAGQCCGGLYEAMNAPADAHRPMNSR